MSAIQTIVVAVDFSDPSNAAVDRAVELAKSLGAEIHVVHAFDQRFPMVSPYLVTKLAGVAEEIRTTGIKVGLQIAKVPAAQAIADAADRVGADLIVMGTRGNAGLKHLVLGSVAERTLRLAKCSVMTVKSS